jgi:hypothetical protein
MKAEISPMTISVNEIQTLADRVSKAASEGSVQFLIKKYMIPSLNPMSLGIQTASGPSKKLNPNEANMGVNGMGEGISIDRKIKYTAPVEKKVTTTPSTIHRKRLGIVKGL